MFSRNTSIFFLGLVSIDDLTLILTMVVQSYQTWRNTCDNFCLNPGIILSVSYSWIPLMARILNRTLCDKVWQWLAGRWFSLVTRFSSNNKTDHYDITEKLSKVASNTITFNPYSDINGLYIHLNLYIISIFSN